MNNNKFSILGWDFSIYLIAVLVIVCLVGKGATVSLSNSGDGTWKYLREKITMEWPKKRRGNGKCSLVEIEKENGMLPVTVLNVVE